MNRKEMNRNDTNAITMPPLTLSHWSSRRFHGVRLVAMRFQFFSIPFERLRLAAYVQCQVLNDSRWIDSSWRESLRLLVPFLYSFKWTIRFMNDPALLCLCTGLIFMWFFEYFPIWEILPSFSECYNLFYFPALSAIRRLSTWPSI